MKRLVFLAVFLFACATENTFTEKDRFCLDQGSKAVKKARAQNIQPENAQPLADADQNLDSLQKTHGKPKPENDKEYTPKNAGDSRKESEESHTSSALWGSLLIAALWFVREAGTRWCPFIGPLIDKISPKLNNGNVANEHSAVASMEVIDEAISLIPQEKKAEFRNTMDRIFSRYGVASHASALYQKYVP